MFGNFNKLLGFSMEGFEEEILDLLNRISERRQKGKGKGGAFSTCFNRELKIFKWIVNDKERMKVGESLQGLRLLSRVLDELQNSIFEC